MLLAALVVPVLPVLAAAPAYAVDNVICVNTADASCSQTVGTIPLAISAANANSLDDTILVGPGTYTDGPYQLFGVTHRVTLKGSGQDSTFLTLPDSASQQTYVTAQQGTVQDLTITLQGGANSDNDIGLALSEGSVADTVTINGAGTINARGVNMLDSQVTSSSVLMPLTDIYSRGVFGDGGSTVTDTVIEGAEGFVHSGGGPADTLSRVTIRATNGVSLDSGTVNIDNSVVRIMAPSGGVGLLAANPNNGVTDKTINADHVTVVGGGPGSVGVAALAQASGAKQTSLVTLDDSIVRGQHSSLEVAASNDGAQGGNSDAKILVQYSSYDTDTKSVNIGANGTGDVFVGVGTLDDPDPLFADPANGDYRLSPASPLVDAGNPAAGGAATDRDGTTRVVDGNVDTTAVRDMGAYEFHDSTAPDTTLTSGPSGPTSDSTPTFAFSSELGATFRCKVDAAAYSPCASPFTTAALSEGAHTFSVQALDTFGNLDPTPAARSVIVDTVGPATTFKQKPAKQVTVDTVKFKFKASEAGSTFQCSIDGRRLRACKPTKNFQIGLGKHKVKVRAVDALGNTGRFAKYTFTRVRGCTGEC
jgi:hypothetical protein